jgi:hypothetical protein
MSLPDYYYDLYVAICRDSDSRVIGSGLCYNGERIITCAHVVNSALGFDQTDFEDKTGKHVQLRFSLSTLLDVGKIYKAKVVQWFPPADPEKFLLKNDLAVLELEDVSVQDLLQTPAAKLRFVADDVKDNQLVCMSHNTRSAADDIFEINGIIRHYLPAEGKTQISTSSNTRDAFFREGSSGSPVFSETLNGISGIVDQLIKNSDATYANMIDARWIGTLLKNDITVHRPSFQKKSREEKKFLCDRKQVVDGISNELINPSSRGNFFFLYGNHRQEGATFRKRYEQQFFDSKEITPIPIGLKSKALPLFKSDLYAALTGTVKPRPADMNDDNDILTYYNALKGENPKVFSFCINDFAPEDTDCYKWFANDFLKLGKAAYPKNLHILIVYVYPDFEAADAASNLKTLSELFGVQAAFPLENVNRKDIYKWISLFEEDDIHPFKSKLLKLLDVDKDYPMKDIFDQYDKAIKEIPDHEKF